AELAKPVIKAPGQTLGLFSHDGRALLARLEIGAGRLAVAGRGVADALCFRGNRRADLRHTGVVKAVVREERGVVALGASRLAREEPRPAHGAVAQPYAASVRHRAIERRARARQLVLVGGDRFGEV